MNRVSKIESMPPTVFASTTKPSSVLIVSAKIFGFVYQSPSYGRSDQPSGIVKHVKTALLSAGVAGTLLCGNVLIPAPTEAAAIASRANMAAESELLNNLLSSGEGWLTTSCHAYMLSDQSPIAFRDYSASAMHCIDCAFHQSLHRVARVYI
jgi:hypothetical protein